MSGNPYACLAARAVGDRQNFTSLPERLPTGSADILYSPGLTVVGHVGNDALAGWLLALAMTAGDLTIALYKGAIMDYRVQKRTARICMK